MLEEFLVVKIQQLRNACVAVGDDVPSVSLHSYDIERLREKFGTNWQTDDGECSIMGVEIVVDDRMPPLLA